MKAIAALLAAAVLVAPSALAKPKAPPKAPPKALGAATPEALMEDVAAGKDLFATVETPLGTIVLKLWSKQAPKTVANFVGLASGGKQWKDLRTGEEKHAPFYDGLMFHRVIPGFMIQGGDPLGTGTGNPGYQFEDENQVPIDRAGLLAMANAGPNTNGSQFFITETPQPRLRTYNTFGEVVSGQEVVAKIGHTPTAPGDRPLTPVTMKVTISETAPANAPPATKAATAPVSPAKGP